MLEPQQGEQQNLPLGFERPQSDCRRPEHWLSDSSGLWRQWILPLLHRVGQQLSTVDDHTWSHPTPKHSGKSENFTIIHKVILKRVNPKIS